MRRVNKSMNWKLSTEQEEPQQTITMTSHQPQVQSQVMRVIENHVYFYGDIVEDNILQLTSTLNELDAKFQMQNVFIETEPVIHLHINSYGGSLFAGIAAVDVIRSLKCKVHSHIEGGCASAATLISVCCDHRTIGKHSKMLIHQLSGAAYGTYTQMEDATENNRTLMATIKSIYKEYTSLPMKNLNEILKHDLWFDSKKCLEFKLVDQVN